MKQIARLIFLLMFFPGCKCRIASSPLQTVYESIKISKENHAFICELQPAAPSLKINGVNYIITESWLEHPHYEKNFSDELVNIDTAIVVNFHYEPNDSVDLKSFVKENGNGLAKIWV